MFESSRPLDSRRNHSRFGHGVYRWDCRERGVARPANKSQCHRHGCAMGSRVLCASSLGIVTGRRLVRRSLRTPSHLLARCCDFRRRIRPLRFCREHSSIDRSPRDSGIRRGTSCPGQPCDHQQFFLGAGTRPRNWRMVGLQRHHYRNWAGSRRMAHRACFMARRVFHQCSARILL